MCETLPSQVKKTCLDPFAPPNSRRNTLRRVECFCRGSATGTRLQWQQPGLSPPAAILLASALVGCTVSGPLDSHAERNGCSQHGVTVNGPSADDMRDVCTGVQSVYRLFRELGLRRTTPITITIVQSMPDALGSNVLGCYTPESNQIRVLTFEAARTRGMWLGRPMDRSLYRSLAAHEVAHALASCNATGEPMSVRAREYVAYSVMFATMDPQHRDAILAATPGSGFVEESQITDMYFYLAPFRFGIDAYRHYLRPENGAQFLRRVVRGSALPAIED